MKSVKKNILSLFISILLFIIVLIIFYPIFTASSLLFPYSISKFDIVLDYPNIWKYIKIAYCLSCFYTMNILVFSIQKYFSIKYTKNINTHKQQNILQINNFKLLIGTKSANNENIYITEKGLYQNILITGTIGSRENCFRYVSIIRAINKI